MSFRSRRSLLAAHIVALCFVPGLSFAQDRFDQPSEEWQFRTSLYGFFPDVGGHARIPSGGELPLEMDAGDLISHTDFAGMASFETRKGRWGGYADAVYMDLGQHVFGTRAILAGRQPLPPGTYADASLDIEALALTLAGTYRFYESPNTTIDALFGGRFLDATVQLDWDFNSDVAGTLRTGTNKQSKASWDGIVGLKGRTYFGERKQWFVPWYADVGTGATDLTWNASAGIGYAAHWGDVFLTYRRLDYDFGQDRHLDDIHFQGPTLGVAFSW
ncbi:hypothetical protein LVB87_13390 [Lysobacter sp. KIS68-7]|uniref:hypothetical protein n=1 Tax=Lysobacter sp. KIS68-7 TaxID=2904252 RepID=UPI001E4D70C8|nr:hypothetical protein [Lysobacter sp. KIS68-7]UHQ19167.1 hypothetical protein LVB87_13390 [Lysobacter sp. KIS68-7]